jgi:AraC-like DNA-binding protein
MLDWSACEPSPTAWYGAGTAFVPALHQPALVYSHARELDVPAARLLNACGLHEADFMQSAVRATPRQWLQLLAQAQAAIGSPETPFAIGRQLLPGHYGAASLALSHAGSLRQALALLHRHAPVLSPLLVPRLVEEGALAVVLWLDAVGLHAQRAFVVDMHMAALVSMTQWLAGDHPPWTFCFNRSAPRHLEQHEVHLGSALRFGCHVDAMLLPQDWLDRPWPAAARPGAAAAQQACERAAALAAGPQRSLLEGLYELMLQHVQQPLALDGAAAHFGLSPATFKRRLAAEGTHYQAELDRVRSHVALYLYQFRGSSNDTVARHLGFHDVPNFRRSFKRWTGVTPSGLKDALWPDSPVACGVQRAVW